MLEFGCSPVTPNPIPGEQILPDQRDLGLMRKDQTGAPDCCPWDRRRMYLRASSQAQLASKRTGQRLQRAAYYFLAILPYGPQSSASSGL